MRVIATAGHVDHGKSSLVKALTGTDPDRLAEEQARQMTIDLGFAALTLPNGEVVGVVDVPGHEDFIANMLAGVGGVDLALLVVAADEGMMPQTHEHLAILDLLNIPRLVVALTKIDRVDDSAWLELVQADISETLDQTHFTNVPIIEVSAHAKSGLPRLLVALQRYLDEDTLPSSSNTAPYLPIDRVFTLSGFGTIVTGTLLKGNLKVGQTVSIQPSGVQGRVRGLQSHGDSITEAEAGSRVAVNLSGVDRDDVRRGDVLSLPATLMPSLLLDVELMLLTNVAHPLKHNDPVKVFIGTAEVMGKVRLLSDETPHWAQLQLYDAVATWQGQRFILRRPSPPQTIGGGQVLDAQPHRTWKRNNPDIIARFERLANGSPTALLTEHLWQARQPLLIHALPPAWRTLLHETSDNWVVHEQWVVHRVIFEQFAERLQAALHHFHRTNSLAKGLLRSRVAQMFRMAEDASFALLEMLLATGIISQYHNFIHLPEFTVQYTPAQQQAIVALREAFAAAPHTPPSVNEALAIVGDEALLDSLVVQGELVRLGSDVLLGSDVYQTWLVYAYEQLQTDGELRPSTMRDAFNTSRKYVMAFLEHLTSRQLTRRVGDVHQLGRADWQNVLPK